MLDIQIIYYDLVCDVFRPDNMELDYIIDDQRILLLVIFPFLISVIDLFQYSSLMFLILKQKITVDL